MHSHGMTLFNWASEGLSERGGGEGGLPGQPTGSPLRHASEGTPRTCLPRKGFRAARPWTRTRPCWEPGLGGRYSQARGITHYMGKIDFRL